MRRAISTDSSAHLVSAILYTLTREPFCIQLYEHLAVGVEYDEARCTVAARIPHCPLKVVVQVDKHY